MSHFHNPNYLLFIAYTPSHLCSILFKVCFPSKTAYILEVLTRSREWASQTLLLDAEYLPCWTVATRKTGSIWRCQWARKRESASLVKLPSIPRELCFFYCAEFFKSEKFMRSVQYQESIRNNVYGSQPRILISFLLRRTEIWGRVTSSYEEYVHWRGNSFK